MADKDIYVINLDFSKMRFLEDGTAVNTSVFQIYSLISLNKKELKEILPEIRKSIQALINKYAEKYQFVNDKD